MKYSKSSNGRTSGLILFSPILVVAMAVFVQACSASAGKTNKKSVEKSDKSDMDIVLKVGDEAPAFSLQDQNGKTVELKDFQDRDLVLIAFYPKDNSPVCSKEMKSFGENYEKFTKLNVEIVGISVDDAESHDAFAKKFGLQFPLLVDEDAKISKAYGAYNDWMNRSSRAYFIVDNKGVIRYALVEKSPASREDTDDLLKIVKDILKGN